MINYRSMNRKNVFSLLIGIVCLVGCGSMNTNASIKREADVKSTYLREVNSEGGHRRAVDREKGESKMIYRVENGKNETRFDDRHSLGTLDESDDSKKMSEKQSERYDETGIAVFISDEYEGVMTASGVRYDRNKMTAAHPSLPFDTKISVTNLRNNRSVEVSIIDRFYPSNDRILNVSYRAAEELDLIESGVAKVGIRILADPESDSN